jgi:hypothetical protein
MFTKVSGAAPVTGRPLEAGASGELLDVVPAADGVSAD